MSLFSGFVHLLLFVDAEKKERWEDEGDWFQSSNLVWKSRLARTLPVNFLL